MLKRTRQVIAIAEIEVAVQIDVVEYSQIPLLQRMRHFGGRLAHANHHRVFDCVYNVHSNHSRFRSCRHQNQVITFHKTDEAQHTVRTDFLCSNGKREARIGMGIVQMRISRQLPCSGPVH